MKFVASLLIFIRTCISYLCIGLLLLITVLPLMLIMLFLPSKTCSESILVYRLLDCIYKGVAWLSFQKVTLYGVDNLPKEPAIFVANHQSALDIILLGSLANGYPHMWYALAYYAQKPVIGFFIRRIGIPLDRSNNVGAARSLMRGIELVQNQQRHIMIFPEGGRYNDGTIHEFLRGFAVIARKTGRPVIPVFMPYNGLVYPPHSFLIHAHELVVTIGAPCVFKTDDTDDAFVERVYAWFEAENKKW